MVEDKPTNKFNGVKTLVIDKKPVLTPELKLKISLLLYDLDLILIDINAHRDDPYKVKFFSGEGRKIVEKIQQLGGFELLGF